MVLEFTEPPDPQLSRVGVLDRTGEPVKHGELTLDADDSSIVRVFLPPLDDGVYTVSWQALSAVDGHVTTGAFSFVVGEVTEDEIAAPAPVEMDERGEVAPLGVAGRWVHYGGLALLLGWAMSTLVAFRAPPGGPSWLPMGCWLLATAGLA